MLTEPDVIREIRPRPDGLVTREQAAALARVTPQAVTNWATTGYKCGGERVKLPVARRESGRPLFDPIEVAKAEYATRRRARRPAA